MNTGIPPITSSPAGVTPAKVDTPSAQAGGKGPGTPAPTPVSLPVNSNSVSFSESAATNGAVSKGGKEQETRRQEANEKPSLQEVIELSEKLNQNVQRIQRDLNFSVDDTLGDIVVQVVDRQTQEVIKQIPSEEMLNLSRNIEEVNSLLFDKIKA